MERFPYKSILEYIPSRYYGLNEKQQADRKAVYDFKDGRCPSALKEQLLNMIRGIIGSDPGAWVVCFIPASTKAKHQKRYGELASYLNRELSCPVYVDGIEVIQDRESGHMTGKVGNPTENMSFNPSRFSGKKVVLIDDVRTRGLTFDLTAGKLLSYGAAGAFGLFLAQTILPDLPVDTTKGYTAADYDEIANDYLSDEARMEELYQQEADEAMAEEAYLDGLYQDMENEVLTDAALQDLYDEEQQRELETDAALQDEYEDELRREILTDEVMQEEYYQQELAEAMADEALQDAYENEC